MFGSGLAILKSKKTQLPKNKVIEPIKVAATGFEPATLRVEI